MRTNQTYSLSGREDEREDRLKSLRSSSPIVEEQEELSMQVMSHPVWNL